MTKSLLIGVLLAVAAPVSAQMPPPPVAMADGMRGVDAMRGPMFAGMSEAGQATMRAAMQYAGPRRDRPAVTAARDRMLALLDADRLDVAALRRAMDDEREAANSAKARRQAAMIGGLQQLSTADRHAYVANARAMRGRMDGMMARWHARRGLDGGTPGMGMVPPPPPH